MENEVYVGRIGTLSQNSNYLNNKSSHLYADSPSNGFMSVQKKQHRARKYTSSNQRGISPSDILNRSSYIFDDKDTTYGINQLKFPVNVGAYSSPNMTTHYSGDGKTIIYKTVKQRIHELFPTQNNVNKSPVHIKTTKRESRGYEGNTSMSQTIDDMSPRTKDDVEYFGYDDIGSRHHESSKYIRVKQGCRMYPGDCHHCIHCNCNDIYAQSFGRSSNRSNHLRSVSSHKIRTHNKAHSGFPGTIEGNMYNNSSQSMYNIQGNYSNKEHLHGKQVDEMPAGWLLTNKRDKHERKNKTSSKFKNGSSRLVSEDNHDGVFNNITNTDEIKSKDFVDLLQRNEADEEENDQENYLSGERMDVVISLARKARATGNMNTQVATILKRDLDVQFGRAWHVITGLGPYGSHVASIPGALAHFRLDDWAYLIWKTPDD